MLWRGPVTGNSRQPPVNRQQAHGSCRPTAVETGLRHVPEEQGRGPCTPDGVARDGWPCEAQSRAPTMKTVR